MIIRASKMERVFRCPGSMKAEEGLEESKLSPEDKAMADSGNRVHEALMQCFGRNITDLNDLAVLCHLTDDEKVKAKWFINHVDTLANIHGGINMKWAELKLPETDDGISGTPDLIIHCHDETYHLIDYKSGWGRQIEAHRNLQLRTYIVKAAEQLSIMLVTVHLFSWGNNPDEGTIYGPDEINAAKHEIYRIRDAARLPNAPRNPHPAACRWCRANGNPDHCPESCKPTTAFIVPAQPLTPEIVGKMKDIYLMFKVAAQAKTRFDAWLREQMTTVPELITWAKFAKPGQRRTITDATKAFGIGIKNGWFDQSEFVKNCITVKVPAIEKLAKRQKLDKTVEPALTAARALEIKENKPSIELIED